ncbi:hypothetical protein BBP40_007001 [Aspergillus hancockii]|nr:hypothetical protein BBP40_007001 [Aspergillus hancockii]
MDAILCAVNIFGQDDTYRLLEGQKGAVYNAYCRKNSGEIKHWSVDYSIGKCLVNFADGSSKIKRDSGSWAGCEVESVEMVDDVTESPDQQRVRLVRQFLDLDKISQEWFPTQEGEPLPRTPTEEEINTILRPWRSADLRRRAWHMYTNVTDEPIFLRTHYNPGDDEKMEHWASISEEFENQGWWACLNNAQLYNFKSDWQRVYEILPEIAGPSTDTQGFPSPEILSSERSRFKTWLSETKQMEPEH